MPQDEGAFRSWYADKAKQYGLNPNPDDPEQFYDYRAAFRAGAKPDASKHWPSQFKRAGHPNEVVGGFNTRTGERVPGTKRASEAELVKSGWDSDTAKRLAQMPEPKTKTFPLASLKVEQPSEVAVSMDSLSSLSAEDLKAIETKYASEEKPLMFSLDQLQVEPPPQAPQEPGMLAKATGAGPMVGGTVGALAGGVTGAALGGAAGEGYEQLIRHAKEIPGAMRDVARNLVEQPAATLQGAKEGALEGAETAGLAGAINAGMEYGGQKVMHTIGSAAKAVYRGYLKPSLAGASKAKAQAIVQAAMDEGLPIAQVGKERADLLIKELRGEVDAILQNRQHISKTLFGDIDLHNVAERVRQFARTKYYKAGRPVEDFEAAMKVADNIDAHPSLNLPPGSAPGPTPVDLATANETKRTLQQSAGEKAFGLERAPGTEAEKRGAHIIRKEIETRAPQIAPLNARESKLIDVAKALSGAIEREANNSALTGVKTVLAATGGGIEYGRTGDPWTAAAKALALRAALAPAAASRMALLAWRISRTVSGIAPASAARLALAVISEQERGDEPEQDQ